MAAISRCFSFAGEGEVSWNDSRDILAETGGDVHPRDLAYAKATLSANATTTRDEEPMLTCIVRPLNDFTNHIGAIRALRRIR